MTRDELLTRAAEIRDGLKIEKDADKRTKMRSEADEVIRAIEDIDREVTIKRMSNGAKETQDRELWDVFGQLMRGEAVSDRGRDALCVRDSGLADCGKDAFRLPGDALEMMTRITRGTTTDSPIGIISSDIAAIIPSAPLAPTVMLPLPATPIFDRSTKIGALNGVAIPFVVHTVADPHAGMDITVGTDEGETKGVSDKPTLDELAVTTNEHNAYIIVSDLALRRAPEYAGMIQTILTNQLGQQIDAALITAILAKATQVTRVVANQVSWADLIHLEGAVPSWAGVQGEYAVDTGYASGAVTGSLTYLKSVQASGDYGPLYAATTANAAYTSLNGRPYFIGDNIPALGADGDVIYGDFRYAFTGVGQDIVFRRSDEGLTLRKRNSTIFTIFAHLGAGVPIGIPFAYLDADVTTTAGS